LGRGQTNLRRGFFRLWLGFSALFVIATAVVYFKEVKSEFEMADFVPDLPVSCPDVPRGSPDAPRGRGGDDYTIGGDGYRSLADPQEGRGYNPEEWHCDCRGDGTRRRVRRALSVAKSAAYCRRANLGSLGVSRRARRPARGRSCRTLVRCGN